MKLNAAPRILIVAALCALGLIGLVITESNARAGGLEALLPMEAVDPRALLSGHYVQINLTERLDAGEQCPAGGPDSKWIALRRDGDVYVLAGGAASRAGAQQLGPTPVKGSFNCTPPSPTVDGVDGSPGWVMLDLGISRFHINQTDALRIEQVLRAQQSGEARAFAIVSIGGDGRARLRGLMVDGERLELNWL